MKRTLNPSSVLPIRKAASKTFFTPEKEQNIIKAHTVKAVFRKYNSEIIALFPYSNCDANLNVDSYMSKSGMGRSNVFLVMRNSTPALPSEYIPLIKELESKPYYLIIESTKDYFPK